MSEDKPNWRSKSAIAHVAHLGVAVAGIFGVLADPGNAHLTVPAWITGHLGIAGLHNTSTAATERAQAYSPNYPLPVEPAQAPTSGPGVTIRPPS